MKTGKYIATAFAALSLGVAPVAVQAQDQQIQTEPMQQMQGAPDSNISEATDGELVELSGTARDVNDDSFTLDHAEGSIDVTMDEEYMPAGGDVREGERVRVSGLVSDGWLTSPSIQAHSVQAETPDAGGLPGTDEMNAPESYGDDVAPLPDPN